MVIEKLKDALKTLDLASGCTDVSSIAYLVAEAKDKVEEPYNVTIELDPNTYRNALVAMVPGGGKGIEAAVKRGLVSKPNGLMTLANDNGTYNGEIGLNIEVKNVNRLYISVGINGEALTIIDNYKKVFFEKVDPFSIERQTFLDGINIYEIPNYAKELARDKEIEDLIVENVVQTLKIVDEKNLEKSTLYYKLNNEPEYIKRTVAAIELRMKGINAPALVVGNSGNQGLMTTLPILYFRTIHDERRKEAILISWLVTLKLSEAMGSPSPYCGLVHRAGVGMLMGLLHLLGVGPNEMEGYVNALLTGLGGTLCKGANEDCAKIAFFVLEVIENIIKNRITTQCLADNVKEIVKIEY